MLKHKLPNGQCGGIKRGHAHSQPVWKGPVTDASLIVTRGGRHSADERGREKIRNVNSWTPNTHSTVLMIRPDGSLDSYRVVARAGPG